MEVILYHEIAPGSKEEVLAEGIKQNSEGEKTDPVKRKVDTFLDTHRPEWVRAQDLNRAKVNYMYLCDGDDIIDITDGSYVSVRDFMNKKSTVLLRVTADVEYCYVSDLDLYDTLMRALELDEQDSTREHLADRYWERVTPLKDYEDGSIARPEVMVNCDIDPKNIEVVELTELIE